MSLLDLLPPDLAGPATTITPIAAGLSGAGVHRVEAAGQSFVLKVAAESEGAVEWRRAVHVQRLAAGAGLAPRVVHVDEARRAVLTAFVADRGFPTFYRDPSTHEAALEMLGRTVRRIHALPIPDDATRRDPRAFLAQVRDVLLAGFALPGFVVGAVERAMAEASAIDERAWVLGHNDLNPSNLVYDGDSIVVLDWATAGPMDAFYDLAVLSLFLRMDGRESLGLISAYEGNVVAELPDRFVRMRRVAGALAGALQMHLARVAKHPGARGGESIDEALSLGDFYAAMRTGTLKLGTGEGQWAFGLALVKESLAL